MYAVVPRWKGLTRLSAYRSVSFRWRNQVNFTIEHLAVSYLSIALDQLSLHFCNTPDHMAGFGYVLANVIQLHTLSAFRSRSGRSW